LYGVVRAGLSAYLAPAVRTGALIITKNGLVST